MDINKYLSNPEEKPLENIALNGGMCRIFREIACVGDSLSSGEFQMIDEKGVDQYYDMYEYSWGQHLARMTGAKVYNFSRGGMTAKEYIESFADAQKFWDPAKACQAYVIALGVNDLRTFEIGSIDDIDFSDYRNNKETFAGYYGAIIQRYKEIQPRARFFFVSIPKDINVSENIEGHRDLLKQLTEKFDNSYLIDLYEYAPVYDEKVHEEFFIHGHMSPSGYVFTADMIASYMDYIIRNNPQDFKDIGFIGTNIKDNKKE